MKTSLFNNLNGKYSMITNKFPSILVEHLQFQTTDPNWASRLGGSILSISFSCFDKEKKLLGKTSQTLKPFVSPYQFQPYIFFNNYPIRFDINSLFVDKLMCNSYEIELELSGITFSEDESYTLQFHLLEHSSYQIYCNRITIASVFITENHPISIGKKNVTLIPFIASSESPTSTVLNMQKHQNFIIDENVTDDAIITDFFSKNLLRCSEQWTKSKL